MAHGEVITESAVKKIDKLYTVILGVENTDENGMAGDIKDIITHLKELNGSVKTNTAWRKVIVSVGGSIGGFAITALALHLIGVY